MKEPKLVIVCGMSGVGESTTAQNISYLYDKNGINHEWYHEEMESHCPVTALADRWNGW